VLWISLLIGERWLSLMDNFYTYAYLRVDRTPYYIGKGSNGRAYSTNRHITVPKDKDRILFLKQNLTEEEAFKHEKYMIAILGRIDLGTGILRNLTDGGEGASGAVKSKETKKKISKSKIGKQHSDKSIRKMSESHKGKILSEEHKKKISEANKGRTISEENRLKLSESRSGENHPFYGKTHSEEHKIKISEALMGEKNHFFGKHHSEETKRKISESLKARNKPK